MWYGTRSAGSSPFPITPSFVQNGVFATKEKLGWFQM
jgi:hypothetical protein